MKPATTRPGVRLRAPAKINLGLAVGPRRPDGYHDLETLLVRIPIYDEIALRRTRADIRLRLLSSPPPIRPICLIPPIPPTTIPSDERNIAAQAARRFLTAAGLTCGVAITLRKHIPAGAGLGGGSSDAAAVLRGLNRLFGHPLSQSRLHELAAQLGSDVPFFLYRSPCLARGRGEILEPVRLPKLRILLHIPAFPISTAWAYQELDRLRARYRFSPPGTLPVFAPKTGGVPIHELTPPSFSLRIALARLRAGDWRRLNVSLRNSFEDVVFGRHPELAQVKVLMLAAGADAALLSGSGSALFAIVHGRNAKTVKRALEQKQIPFLSLTTIA